MAQKFLTNIDLNQNQLIKTSFQQLADDPSSNVFEGWVYYNTTSDTLRIYANGGWRTFLNGVTAGNSSSTALTVDESGGTVAITLNPATTSTRGTMSAADKSKLDDATSEATADKLVIRDGAGNIKVATPTDNAHATTKLYVDTAISGVTGSITVAGDSGSSQTISLNDTLTISGGTGLSSAASATDTLTINLDNTAVTAGSYGSASVAGTFTVDAQGRLTAASNATIAITASAVTDFNEAAQDAVGNAVGTGLTYTDGTGAISVTANTYDAYGSASVVAGNLTTHTSATEAHGATGAVVGTTNTQTLTNKTLTSPAIDGSGVIFEGATANDFETTLAVTDPTADRTITLPDATGTVALTNNKLDVFAATTSAELRTVISDETGTGGLVFADTPTLVTPNIGAATGTSLVLSGDLTVNGTTTTINSTEITVDDKNLVLGSVETPTDAGADGGGITLKGTTDKTLNWVDATDSWTSSENLNVVSGKTLKIGGTDVLSASVLGSGILASSLTSVGTITSGVWNGTDIAVADGGTGASTAEDARANLAAGGSQVGTSAPTLTRKVTQVIGDGAATSFAVTHGFGIREVMVQVYDQSTYETVITDVVRTETNLVTVSFSTAPPTNQYKVVVIG
jgi:hypothetical protein